MCFATFACGCRVLLNRVDGLTLADLVLPVVTYRCTKFGYL
jgi:hypothetical protein